MLKEYSWPRDKRFFWEAHCQGGAEERKKHSKSSLFQVMALQDEIGKDCFSGV